MGSHSLLQGIFPTHKIEPKSRALQANFLPAEPQGKPENTGVDGGGGVVAKMCPTLAIAWTVARHAPLSMRFSWQEYWSGLPFPSPGDLPSLGIELTSPALAGRFTFTTEPPGKPRRKN